MHTVVRRLTVPAVALAAAGSLLVPMTTHAAAPAHHAPAPVVYAPAYVERTYRQGYHTFDIFEHVRTNVVVRHGFFGLHIFSDDLRGRLLYAPHGLFKRNSVHDVLAQFAVPADARPGLYTAGLRLYRYNEDRDVVGVGTTMLVRVRILRPTPSPPPTPTHATIDWNPSVLGTIVVEQGQTVTETVSFQSTADLSRVQVQRDLGDLAIYRGVGLRVVSTSLTSGRAAANTPINVTFAVRAGGHAVVGSYGANLHIAASFGHYATGRILRHFLPFTIAVNPGPTPTATVTSTPVSATSTSTATAMSTSTSTATAVPTGTSTSTSTPAPTGTSTPAISSTSTLTPTGTSTSTTPAPTGTSTSTPAPTGTSTSTPAPTGTGTPAATSTATGTSTGK